MSDRARMECIYSDEEGVVYQLLECIPDVGELGDLIVCHSDGDAWIQHEITEIWDTLRGDVHPDLAPTTWRDTGS